MRRLVASPILLVALALSTQPASADLASDLSRLTGYVIFDDETIDDFEGCEYGKIIQFRSGGHVTCNDYGYQYSYGADAVILVRPIDKATYLCAMIVEDEIYEVSCGRYMHEKITFLRRFRDQATDEKARQFVDYRLRILGIQE